MQVEKCAWLCRGNIAMVALLSGPHKLSLTRDNKGLSNICSFKNCLTYLVVVLGALDQQKDL
eukprot:1737413-Amphidinium_carterae.1